MHSKAGFGVVIALVVAFAIGQNKQDYSPPSRSAVETSTTAIKPVSNKPAVKGTVTKVSELTPGPLPVWPGWRQLHGPDRSMASTGSRSVALTFDDGPGPYTHLILDLLEHYHVKATFCLIGRQVLAYRAEVERMIRDGDTLCNHTWDHDEDLGARSLKTIEGEMVRTTAAIHKIDPKVPVRYFRNPGGNFTKTTVRVCEHLGMRPLFWSVDTRDWSLPGIGHIESILETRTHAGSIVLMHDGGGNRSETVRALGALLPDLARRFHLIALPV